MIIRATGHNDVRAIAEVHVRSWQAAYVGLVLDYYLASLSVDRREVVWRGIVTEADRPQGDTLVVVKGSAVVGFADVGPCRDQDADPNVGKLRAIYVDPSQWGRGGGRLLLGEALARLRADGFTDATLWVLDSNQQARRFYEGGGWRYDDVAKVDTSRGFPLRDVRYRRDLRVVEPPPDRRSGVSFSGGDSLILTKEFGGCLRPMREPGNVFVATGCV